MSMELHALSNCYIIFKGNHLYRTKQHLYRNLRKKNHLIKNKSISIYLTSKYVSLH